MQTRALICSRLSRNGTLFNITTTVRATTSFQYTAPSERRAFRNVTREAIRHRIREAAGDDHPSSGKSNYDALDDARVAHRNRCKLPAESRTVWCILATCIVRTCDERLPTRPAFTLDATRRLIAESRSRSHLSLSACLVRRSHLRVNLVHVLEILPEVILRDAQLRLHPLQRPVDAVPLRHPLERGRHRSAGLQPGLHVVGIGRESETGGRRSRSRVQPPAQKEGETRESDRLCHRICNRKQREATL